MKKIFSIILAALLVSSVFVAVTACGSDAAADEAETTVQAEESGADKDSAEKTDDKAEKEDGAEAEVKETEGESVSNDTTSEETKSEEVLSELPDALKGYTPIATDKQTLAGTTWSLSGGVVNGANMSDKDVQAKIDANGGKFEISFLADAVKDVVRTVPVKDGTALMAGNCYIANDGHTIYMDYSVKTQFTGVMTKVGEKTVLAVIDNNDPATILYYSQVENQ